MQLEPLGAVLGLCFVTLLGFLVYLTGGAGMVIGAIAAGAFIATTLVDMS